MRRSWSAFSRKASLTQALMLLGPSFIYALCAALKSSASTDADNLALPVIRIRYNSTNFVVLLDAVAGGAAEVRSASGLGGMDWRGIKCSPQKCPAKTGRVQNDGPRVNSQRTYVDGSVTRAFSRSDVQLPSEDQPPSTGKATPFM